MKEMKQPRQQESERPHSEMIAPLLMHLQRAPQNRPVVVLLRHSIRGELPSDGVGMDLPITAEGAAAAELLGASGELPIKTLHTSPFLRCLQTASAIREGGAAHSVEIVPNRLLGDPGIFVYDDQQAWHNWKEHGNLGVMRIMMSRAQPLPGMRHYQQTSQQLVREMFKVANGAAGLHYFVSHDTFVLTVASWLFDEPLSDDEWPGFLEAIVFWEEEGRLAVSYRNRQTSLPFEWSDQPLEPPLAW